MEKSGKIGAISFSLSSGASGDIDISSANLVRCIKVEAGKDPVTEDGGNTISVIGEDYSTDVFDCRYEPADDGEAFSVQNTAKPAKKNEDLKKGSGALTVIIIIGGVLLAGSAAAGVFYYGKKRGNKK